MALARLALVAPRRDNLPVPDDVPYLLADEDMEIELQEATREEYWRRLVPGLSLTLTPFDARPSIAAPGRDEVNAAVTSVVSDGYFRFAPLIPGQTLEPLAKAVSTIVRNGLHPLFLMVYDEPWAMLAALEDALTPIFGGPPLLVPDFWVWHVSPDGDPSGWTPHRDFQYRHAVRDDGRPLLGTIWIPFTDATPENSCISVLPLSKDPDFPDHLRGEAVPDPGRSVMLPALRGSILGWNQLLLHWGSPCGPAPPFPRINVGIYVQSPDVPPFDAVAFRAGGSLPLADRLAFIGRALYRYRDRFRFPPALIRSAERWAGAFR